MGGVWALFAIGAAQVFLVAGAANAAGASSFDDFLTFDGFVAYGRVMQTRKTGLPKGSMYLYANPWFSAWLNGKGPLLDPYPYVDRPATRARTAVRPAPRASAGPRRCP